MNETILYTPETVRDPRNHPRRIYVSCHPKDLHRLEEICSMTRSAEPDCVIAYRDPKADPQEISPEDLEDFHLIVVPVTQNRFDRKTGVHGEEFRFVRQAA